MSHHRYGAHSVNSRHARNKPASLVTKVKQLILESIALSGA